MRTYGLLVGKNPRWIGDFPNGVSYVEKIFSFSKAKKSGILHFPGKNIWQFLWNTYIHKCWQVASIPTQKGSAMRTNTTVAVNPAALKSPHSEAGQNTVNLVDSPQRSRYDWSSERSSWSTGQVTVRRYLSSAPPSKTPSLEGRFSY